MTTAQKYRKKPVVIEAMHWDGTEESTAAIKAWVPNAAHDRILLSASRHNHEVEQRFYINTLEGPMTAKVGDYIIRGVQGEFYPCKPDIFTATYTRA